MRATNLIKHPEGGRYCETYRSRIRIQSCDGRPRDALTHIYFSLSQGEVSHFHRIGGDEVWNLYKGRGLRLYLWDGKESRPDYVDLSAKNEEFCHVVPAGVWQAAIPTQGAVLVGCSVAPGFEFEDFELLEREFEEGEWLLISSPDLMDLVYAS